MKFGAVLRDSAVDLPDTEDLFLKYKQLKKSLKRMQASGNGGAKAITTGEDSPSDTSANEDADPATKRAKTNEQQPEQARPAAEAKNAEPSKDVAAAAAAKEKETTSNDQEKDGAPVLLDPELEAEFLRVITSDVMELNDRYIEREEDNVIKFEQLEEAAEHATTSEAKVEIYRAFVDFHGELLMLFHWSVLAYTGLVKILKKHRKRTGAPLHAPHLENLLSQPFCSVEVTCDMIRKAEEWVTKLAKDMDVAPPPPVPLPENLLTGGAGGGGGSAADGSETLTSSHDKARVLEAVAAAVEAAEAAEAKAEGEKQQQKEGNAAAQQEEKKQPAAGAAADNVATRRIKAALNVWKQLHANASTPSTLIAPGSKAPGGAPGEAPPISNLTNSSVA